LLDGGIAIEQSNPAILQFRNPAMTRCLLISTYEMGRQPFGMASAAAWLRAAGVTVECVDTARQRLNTPMFPDASLVGFHLPMHTATRLAGPIITRARQENPGARLCAFGLYAPLNAEWLRSLGVEAVFGGEFEEELTAWAVADARLKDTPSRTVRAMGTPSPRAPAEMEREALRLARPERVEGRARSRQAVAERPLPRLHFLVPDRAGLPPLSRYASLQLPDGTRRAVAYTEASRGCKHLCRHCPIVPVYNGQFRIVPPDVVMADIDAQVRSGAEHVTFGDPDFFNGPTHAMRIVDALHTGHPRLSYDVTIKVEHLLRHRDLLPRLAETGCLFVTSAVESIDDRVLTLLEKGHTRADFVEAVPLTRRAGVTLVPTFVAFHPWLALEGYCDLLDTIAALDLVDHVAPIQLAIRLLLPEGSPLLARDEMRRHVGEFDAAALAYRWTHPDPRVDLLQREVMAIVGAKLNADRRAVFEEVAALAYQFAGRPYVSPKPVRDRATVAYLNEPWYC
jgi:radical SAM superfamily enzyme YgiQ (UPF0313 family)